MSKPLKGFITYSHKDQKAKDELITRLAVMVQQGEIETWHDGEITAGDKWYEDISSNLAESDILLYLVSATSLASKNCNKELAEALNVNAKIRVIPIILESCDWLKHELSDFQALPDKGLPINEWQPEDKGWQNVVEGIRKAVDKMQTQMDAPSEASEKDLRAELVFQQGNVLMMLGQIDRAIETYSHSIHLNPNLTEAYNNRGIAYHDKDEVDRAIEDFAKAIELKPDYAEVYNNRGIVYGTKGEVDCAIEDFNKAIELRPDYANAYYNRGIAYGTKGEVDCAIKDYNKAIELKPDYANAYNNRGVAYHDKDEVDRAIEDYTKAIQLNPNLTEAYNNSGNAYVKKGEIDRAIGDFNKAIGLNPEFALAYYNRGAAWLRLREWERAKSDLTIARDMGMNIITLFRNDYESVESFEGRNGVQLPKDIAAMLTLP